MCVDEDLESVVLMLANCKQHCLKKVYCLAFCAAQQSTWLAEANLPSPVANLKTLYKVPLHDWQRPSAFPCLGKTLIYKSVITPDMSQGLSAPSDEIHG